MKKPSGISAAAWFYSQPGFHAPQSLAGSQKTKTNCERDDKAARQIPQAVTFPPWTVAQVLAARSIERDDFAQVPAAGWRAGL